MDGSPAVVDAHHDIWELRRDMINTLEKKRARTARDVLDQLAELKHDKSQAQRHAAAPKNSAAAAWKQPSPLAARFSLSLL